MRRLFAAVSVVLLVAVGACSSSDDDVAETDEDAADSRSDSDEREDVEDERESGDDEDRDDYVAAMIALYQSEGGAPLSDADVACLAAAAVDGIGVDTFAAADVAPVDLVGVHDLSEFDLGDVDDLVEAIADASESCDVDFSDVLRDEAPDFSDVGLDERHIECFVESMAAQPGLSRGFLDALAQRVMTGDASGSYEAGVSFGEDASAKAFAECPEAVAVMLLYGASQAGVAVTDDQRSCVEDEISTLSPDEIAGVVTQDSSARAVVVEIFTGCGLAPTG